MTRPPPRRKTSSARFDAKPSFRVHAFSTRWDQFFFLPSRSPALAAIRIAVGLVALLHLLGWLWDVLVWFGPDGLLPARLTRQMLAGDGAISFRISPLFLSSDPRWVLFWPAVGALGAVMLALGWRARVGAALAWISVLSLLHRGPAISGPLEAILAPLLFYLMIARSDHLWSLAARGRPAAEPAVSTRLGLRCVQLHLAIAVLGLGLAKHSVAPWQDGEAVWWLAMLREQPLGDQLAFLQDAFWVSELWTHAAVAFELAFPVLIWVPALRRWMIGAGLLHWLLFAALTGQVLFCMLMAAGMLAFAFPDDQPSARG